MSYFVITRIQDKERHILSNYWKQNNHNKQMCRLGFGLVKTKKVYTVMALFIDSHMHPSKKLKHSYMYYMYLSINERNRIKKQVCVEQYQ
jgi:hypothetical protein